MLPLGNLLVEPPISSILSTGNEPIVVVSENKAWENDLSVYLFSSPLRGQVAFISREQFCERFHAGTRLAFPDVLLLSYQLFLKEDSLKTKKSLICYGKEEEMSDAFNRGVVDFICMPISIVELIARIAHLYSTVAFLRYFENTIVSYKNGSFLNGIRIRLPIREALLLFFLVKNKSKIMSSDRLCFLLGGAVKKSSLSMLISRLKKHLEKLLPGGSDLVVSIYGRGYLVQDI